VLVTATAQGNETVSFGTTCGLASYTEGKVRWYSLPGASCL
jgi:hypothetical protein